MKNTIQSQWELFEKIVIPFGAPEIQKIEMKKAFYAGAGAILNISLNIGDDSISEDAGVQIMQGLHDEFACFAKKLINEISDPH